MFGCYPYCRTMLLFRTRGRVQPFGLRSHCGWGEGAQQQAICRNSFPRRHRLLPALPYRATLSSLGSRWFLVSFLIEHGPGLLTGTSDLKAATLLKNLITAWVNRWSVYTHTHTHPRSQGYMHTGQNYIHVAGKD